MHLPTDFPDRARRRALTPLARSSRHRHSLGVLAIAVLVLPLVASADQFDRYRHVIDRFHEYPVQERETTIAELEGTKTSSIEKNYLLGMLYFIQGVERMKTIARAQEKKPRVEEVLKDKTVQGYFQKAEANYDAVQSTSPGYKYIYCKYGELYRYSFNEDGLRKVTRQVGRADQNDRLEQCKAMLEDVAEGFVRYGYVGLSKVIYEEAVRTWRPYSIYMLEALGDIEQVQKNKAKAVYWWKRCVAEARSTERKQRCAAKGVAQP